MAAMRRKRRRLVLRVEFVEISWYAEWLTAIKDVSIGAV